MKCGMERVYRCGFIIISLNGLRLPNMASPKGYIRHSTSMSGCIGPHVCSPTSGWRCIHFLCQFAGSCLRPLSIAYVCNPAITTVGLCTAGISCEEVLANLLCLL
eukprot:COSAG01_NODE_4272_length_5193_cov_7.742638_2_plen_105_part_00